MDIPTLAWGVQRQAALAVYLSAALALGGCAGFSRDGGFTPVADSSQQRLGKQVKWARSPLERASIEQRVAELLQQPYALLRDGWSLRV